MVHPLRGAIFETFVVSELLKTKLNRGEQASFHFWRDSNGNEIDVIADLGVKSMPIEIKSGQTLNRDFFKALKNWLPLAGKEAVFSIISVWWIRQPCAKRCTCVRLGCCCRSIEF